MGGLDNAMPIRIDERPLLLSWLAPHHKHARLRMFSDLSNGMVRQLFPTTLLVRVGLAFPNGEDGVEQQHALASPGVEVAGDLWREAQIGLAFFEDVAKRRRVFDTRLDGEAKSVRLTRTVVRILAKDYDSNLIEGRELKSSKDLVFWRKDAVGGALVTYKMFELCKAIALHRFREFTTPIVGQTILHTHFVRFHLSAEPDEE